MRRFAILGVSRQGRTDQEVVDAVTALLPPGSIVNWSREYYFSRDALAFQVQDDDFPVVPEGRPAPEVDAIFEDGRFVGWQFRDADKQRKYEESRDKGLLSVEKCLEILSRPCVIPSVAQTLDAKELTE